MTEPVTQSQLTEVLETVKAIQSQLTELTLEVKVGQAEIREKFNTMEAKIEAVRLEVQTNREQLVELGKRQSSTETNASLTPANCIDSASSYQFLVTLSLINRS